MKKILGLLTLSVGLYLNAQTYDIKLQLEKGKTYFIKSNVNSVINQNVMGQQMEIKNDVLTDLSFKVLSKSGDKYTLETKHDKMEMLVNMMGKEMKMSSEDKTNDEKSKGFVMMKDQVFTVIMDEKGNVVDVIGYDKVIEKMLAGVPEASRAVAQEQFKSIASKDMIQSSLKQFFQAMPKTKVKIGDKWTDKNVIISTMKMNAESTFTLAKADDKSFTIDYVGVLKSNPNDKVKLSGMDATSNLDGTISGSITLDAKTGWMATSVSKNDVKGKLSIDANGIPMEVDMNIVSDTKSTN